MRHAILLITLNLFLSGCDYKDAPDAFICSFILKEPIENSYSFCVNYKTKEEKSVSLKDMAKYITTDPDSYETTRDWYKEQCVPEKRDR